jgi:hypothetical protein
MKIPSLLASLTLLCLHALPAPASAQTPPPAQSEALPSAESLFGKYFRAIGVSSDTAPIQSLRIKGKGSESNGANAKESTPFEASLAAAPRRSVFSMSGLYQTGWDGKTVWEREDKEPKVLTGKEAHLVTVGFSNLIFPDPAHWKLLGTARCVGTQEVEGTPCYTVECVRETFPPIRLYFSTESGLLMRKDWACPHHDAGDKDSHSFFQIFTDYKEVNGIAYPHTLATGALNANGTPGDPSQVFTIESLEINPTLPENTFALPPGLPPTTP